MSVRQFMWTDNRQTMERNTAEFLAGLNHIPEGTEAKNSVPDSAYIHGDKKCITIIYTRYIVLSLYAAGR